MTDPNIYRDYECNIRCPKMSARIIRCNKLIVDSCVQSYEGCVSGVSKYHISSNELPPLAGPISGKLTVYFRDASKGGYSEVYLSIIGGNVAITPISTMTFNSTTSVTMDNSRVLITVGSVGDVGWKYNGL